MIEVPELSWVDLCWPLPTQLSFSSSSSSTSNTHLPHTIHQIITTSIMNLGDSNIFIPTISLSTIDQPQTLNLIHHSLTSTGFIYLTHPILDQSSISNIFKISKSFFNQTSHLEKIKFTRQVHNQSLHQLTDLYISFSPPFSFLFFFCSLDHRTITWVISLSELNRLSIAFHSSKSLRSRYRSTVHLIWIFEKKTIIYVSLYITV